MTIICAVSVLFSAPLLSREGIASLEKGKHPGSEMEGEELHPIDSCVSSAVLCGAVGESSPQQHPPGEPRPFHWFEECLCAVLGSLPGGSNAVQPAEESGASLLGTQVRKKGQFPYRILLRSRQHLANCCAGFFGLGVWCCRGGLECLGFDQHGSEW